MNHDVQDEIEVVEQAVKVALHTLMEIAQDDTVGYEARLMASGIILDHAEHAYPVTMSDEQEIEEEEEARP
jgi:hypothetical protein